MGFLHSAALLSVLFACGMVSAQYRFYDMPRQLFSDPFGNSPVAVAPVQYMCGESNLQYDCIFTDVSIGRETHGVRFGHEDWALNNQQNITFKNSTIKILPEALLDSFRYIELLNLTGLQIEEFERFAITNGIFIRKLYMDFNVIRELPIFAFRNMRFLNVLVLDQNALGSLPEGIFFGTPNLTALSIANNNLQRMDDHTFRKNKALQYLRVSDNKLTHIDLSLIPSLFHGDVSSNLLTTLSVPEAVVVLDASHNLINTVTGPNNMHLIILRLQHNKLTETAWLLHYPGLVDVDLSFNELEELNYHHFKNMHRLERLYVANNRLLVMNLGLSPIRTLQILDVRHNRLVNMKYMQEQLDTLEQLYLDHNSIVTLKISANNTLQKVTLSHNDWDCKNLDIIFQNVFKSVIDDSDQQCKEGYELKNSFCCKESDKPYLDRLMQYIALLIDVEKSERAGKRCKTSETIDSVQNLTSYINLHGSGLPLHSNPYLQAEIDQLQQDIERLTYQQSKYHNLHTVVDNHLRNYGLAKEALAGPSENLLRLFAYLDNRRTFKEQETRNRELEADRKKQQVMQLENEAIQNQINANKKKLSDIKLEVRRKELSVKRLEARMKLGK